MVGLISNELHFLNLDWISECVLFILVSFGLDIAAAVNELDIKIKIRNINNVNWIVNVSLHIIVYIIIVNSC